MIVYSVISQFFWWNTRKKGLRFAVVRALWVISRPWYKDYTGFSIAQNVRRCSNAIYWHYEKVWIDARHFSLLQYVDSCQIVFFIIICCDLYTILLVRKLFFISKKTCAAEFYNHMYNIIVLRPCKWQNIFVVYYLLFMLYNFFSFTEKNIDYLPYDNITIAIKKSNH